MPKIVKEEDRHICRTVSMSMKNYRKCLKKGKGNFSKGVRMFIEEKKLGTKKKKR